jgi:APA family basic amino acid/polyamine antiporter
MDATNSAVAIQILTVGGLVATAGVLLTSILGVSRVAFAMAREKDIPKALGKIHPRFGTPYLSIIFVGCLMAVLALFVPLTHVAAVSTFALLFYYSWANICALKLTPQNRIYPKAISAIGLALCLTMLGIVVFANWEAFTVGITCLTIGAVLYVIKRHLEKRKRASRI